MGETSLPPCSARIGRPGWLLPGLRRKARRAGHEGRVPSACRATRAGLDRVRAVAVLADVVAARRAGPGAGAACGHAAGQFQPQGRHDRRARQAMSLHDVRNGVALRGVAQVARGGSASAASQSLRNDWLGEARLLQVRADTTVAMPPPFSGLRISRQVQVLSGAGHARMMRTRSVVSAPRACRGGGYRRFRRNARAPWVNCWRRPSPLGAGPRCPWIGSRHGMTWQRPTACSRMGAAVRLLLSPFFATSCSRGGARAASRFGSVAEICRRALAATLALTAGALPRAGAQTVQALWPDAATRGLVTDGMALAVTRPATPADLQLAAGARRQWLADRLWLYGQPAGVLVFDTPQDVPELIRSLSGQQPALVDLHVLPGQVLLSGRWATRNGWRRWKPWARGVPSAAFLRSGLARRPLLCRPRGCLRTRA